MVLYVWGDLQERDRHAISVVGSRKTSHYGNESAKKLSYQLAYAGITVISGLALGIDTAAHQAALAAKGRTIAVLGSGLNQLYPRENMALAERIAGSGAVVTEFSMEVKPDVQSFPMRNRIVAGWSHGLLVVEAGLNSGALITARQAADEGRTVYAVPGQIDRPSAAGSNRLIQQGAKLVTNAGDILEEMQVLFPERPKPIPVTARLEGLNERELQVYESIGESETAIDAIIRKSNLPSATVSSTLLALEMKRMVKQLPGQHFVRLL
jgi:DNA processing protein